MPAGRKSKYNDFYVRWVRSLARRGLTVQEIADEIEVSKSTLCKWVSEHEELSDALKEGRSFADAKVEDSLYTRAVGTKVTEKKTIISAATADGGQKPVRIEIVEREVAPDVTACIYWLKNRKPQEWRDRVEILSSDAESAIESIAKQLMGGVV